VPELPEVETIVRDLHRLVRGATVTEVTVLRPDVIVGSPADAFERSLAGRRIEDVSRRAKNIVFDLRDGVLVVNLGMTGRLVVHPPEQSEPPHVGVRIRLDDGRTILYEDVRRFGRLELTTHEAWAARSARLGVEPLSHDFTPTLLHRITRGSRAPIKSWLMDQGRVVGVGNIYASEALFRAGIRPTRPAGSLSKPRALRLHAAIREVLQEAIEFRGTTLLDYRDASGETGSFARRLRVYDREGEPCPDCGTRIRRIVQGGRSTYYCPRCQR
jgi:formamidopyrimidine-DNA glycosylase